MAATSITLSWARLTLSLTLTLTRYNFIVAAPCLLILLLYTVPVIISVDSVDYAMGTSQGTGAALAGVASNFSLADGWDTEPSFGSLRPSDMASPHQPRLALVLTLTLTLALNPHPSPHPHPRPSPHP